MSAIDRDEALPRRRFFGRFLATAAGLSFAWRPREARADTQGIEPFLGQIMPIAFNWAPRGWARCDGTLLSISQNQALFAVLGTQYGGNGTTTFALPDLRGRLALHAGQGPGLTNRVIGTTGGLDTHVLTTAEIPAHTHTLRAASATATLTTPSAAGVPARSPSNAPRWGNGVEVPLHASAIANSTGGNPHPNTMPYATINYVIAVTGSFPQP